MWYLAPTSADPARTVVGRHLAGDECLAQCALLELGPDGMLRLTGTPRPCAARLADVRITGPGDGRRRRIHLDDGTIFETDDHLDDTLAALARARARRAFDPWAWDWEAITVLLLTAAVAAWIFVHFESF
jgi:hypothetical protein